jgi:tetratricopeptide (TPR) repeat protein
LAELGALYFEEGRIARSFGFLTSALERDPQRHSVRTKLGLIELARGEYRRARECALYVLERAPSDREAPLLLAESSIDVASAERARDALKIAAAKESGNPAIAVAFGLLAFHTKDFVSAQSEFQHALALDPSFSPASAALGNAWLQKGEIDAADRAFKTAADVSPLRSPRRIAYADFKLERGELAAATRILQNITTNAPDYLPARIGLAKVALRQKQFNDAERQLNLVLLREPSYPEAIFLRVEALIARGAPKPARVEAEKLVSLYPSLPSAHLQLALAYLANSLPERAASSLGRAMALKPDFVEAIVLSADLNVSKNPLETISLLEPLLQAHPDLVQAWLLLGQARLNIRDFDGAQTVCSQLERIAPRDPTPAVLSGKIFRVQNKPDQARQAFERALDKDPSCFPALRQLAELDLAENNIEPASARVTEFLNHHPRSAAGFMLLAELQARQKQTEQAERSLLFAIQLSPKEANLHYALAQLYSALNRPNAALNSVDRAITLDANFEPAWLLKGSLQSDLQDPRGASATYEQWLAHTPRDAAALNNLAFLYSENFNNIDKAYPIALEAYRIRPEDPNIVDTLGWILYRKHQYVRAVTLLDESGRQLPHSAEAQFHRGMAHYRLNDDDAAKKALLDALQPNLPFPGFAQAKTCLSILNLDWDTCEPSAVTSRRDIDLQNDSVALWGLSQILLRKGDTASASGYLQRVIFLNPQFGRAHLELARLYLAKHDQKNAFFEVNAAYRLSPADPQVRRALSELAPENDNESQ